MPWLYFNLLTLLRSLSRPILKFFLTFFARGGGVKALSKRIVVKAFWRKIYINKIDMTQNIDFDMPPSFIILLSFNSIAKPGPTNSEVFFNIFHKGGGVKLMFKRIVAKAFWHKIHINWNWHYINTKRNLKGIDIVSTDLCLIFFDFCRRRRLVAF